MINVPGVASASLDTTSLENSFENLGRTMVDVLAMQQQTNLTLQDQIRRANDAQMDQTLAMHDLADITEQRTYDSMFAAVPIYHGNDDEDFDEWADQLEALCEISHRNIHHESMRQIQDKTPQTLTTIKQPSNTTVTAPVQKAAITVKRRGRPKAHDRFQNTTINRSGICGAYTVGNLGL